MLQVERYLSTKCVDNGNILSYYLLPLYRSYNSNSVLPLSKVSTAEEITIFCYYRRGIINSYLC